EEIKQQTPRVATEPFVGFAIGPRVEIRPPWPGWPDQGFRGLCGGREDATCETDPQLLGLSRRLERHDGLWPGSRLDAPAGEVQSLHAISNRAIESIRGNVCPAEALNGGEIARRRRRGTEEGQSVRERLLVLPFGFSPDRETRKVPVADIDRVVVER